MFLLNTQVDVPEHGTALWKRGSITYCYQLVPVPDRKSPARKLIGRLVSSEPDCSRMFPNERYYALRGFEMPEPDYARISKAGRPSSAVYKEGMRTYPGFALMAFAALERSGAMPFLTEVFGETKAQQIAFLATHFCAGYTSTEDLPLHSVIHNVLKGAQGLTGQGASELLASGIRRDKISAFFDRWIPLAAGHDTAAYDVTALPTQARRIVEAEYGYTHGGPSLPQVNYALFSNTVTGMPLFYEHYSGSLSDKTSLLKVMDTARSHGFEGVKVVMDRGFASGDNIDGLTEMGIEFVMGVPCTFKEVKAKLTEFGKKSFLPFSSRVTGLRHDGTVSEEDCFCESTDFEWHGRKLRLHLYRNEMESARQRSAFTARLRYCRDYALRHDAMPDLSLYSEAASCFHREKGKKGQWILDESAVNDKIARMGCFALFSSPSADLSGEQALQICRSREIDEELFNCLKTDSSGSPLRIHSDDALDGKFFVLFLSAIIRRFILSRTREMLRQGGHSFRHLTDTLNLIEVELRGDGSLHMVRDVPGITLSEMSLIVDREVAAKLGLKDTYTARPKRRATKKEMEERRKQPRRPRGRPRRTQSTDTEARAKDSA